MEGWKSPVRLLKSRLAVTKNALFISDSNYITAMNYNYSSLASFVWGILPLEKLLKLDKVLASVNTITKKKDGRALS